MTHPLYRAAPTTSSWWVADETTPARTPVHETTRVRPPDRDNVCTARKGFTFARRDERTHAVHRRFRRRAPRRERRCCRPDYRYCRGVSAPTTPLPRPRVSFDHHPTVRSPAPRQMPATHAPTHPSTHRAHRTTTTRVGTTTQGTDPATTSHAATAATSSTTTGQTTTATDAATTATDPTTTGTGPATTTERTRTSDLGRLVVGKTTTPVGTTRHRPDGTPAGDGTTTTASGPFDSSTGSATRTGSRSTTAGAGTSTRQSTPRNRRCRT